VTCALSVHSHDDLDLLTVANDELRLVFLPQVGGRLISLQVVGAEVLWRNPSFLDGNLRPLRPRSTWPRSDGSMGSWTNIGGSKTWPAPQGWSGPGQWPGPPDETLDAGPYTPSSFIGGDGAAHVTLTSRVDTHTGIQVARSFTLPARGGLFHQTSSFVNRSTAPVRWAVWEVAQIDTAGADGRHVRGCLQVETFGQEAPRHLIEAFGVPTYELLPGSVTVPVQDCVGKLGFTTATGSIRWLREDGLQVEMRTGRDPEGEYPDGGCPAELWLQCPVGEPIDTLGGLRPDAHLAEMELLSPLTTIAPGACLVLEIDWRCRPPDAARDPRIRTAT
jgi:hypothetical protein